VAAHREDHKTIEHPSVGSVAVDCDVLTDGDSELKIVIMTAVPGSADETKLGLAVIAGPPGHDGQLDGDVLTTAEGRRRGVGRR
jgi:hypothetical protein